MRSAPIYLPPTAEARAQPDFYIESREFDLYMFYLPTEERAHAPGLDDEGYQGFEGSYCSSLA